MPAWSQFRYRVMLVLAACADTVINLQLGHGHQALPFKLRKLCLEKHTDLLALGLAELKQKTQLGSEGPQE